jgi:hypothetical protein
MKHTDNMHTPSRIPNWLIGGAGVWLAYVVTLSFLHLRLVNLWDEPSTLQIYTGVAEPASIIQILLLGMVAPGFFIIDILSFLNIHLAWVDAAIYNWRTMVLLSSLPAIAIGVLLSMKDRRINLAGAILGLALLGGSLLFIVNRMLAR